MRGVAPPLLREKEPTVPPDVEQVVLTALAKEPQRRFGSVQAFANALEQASQAAPAHVPRSSSDDSQLYKPTEMISRHPGSPPFPVEHVLPSQTSYGAQAAYTPPQTPAASQNPNTPPPTLPGPQAPFIAQQAAPQGPYSLPQAPRPPLPLPIPLSPVMAVLLVVLALLLIGGSGLIYYTTVFRPNQLHAQATATAQTQIMGTANANATSTAQAIATTQAETNATATAQAQATANAQATATALQGIYTQATSGTPAINDPLSGGDNFGWVQYGSAGNGCAFTGGAYHSGSLATSITQCPAIQTNFSNFALQVQITIISGHSGGLIFRCDSAAQNFYAFRISTDGSYFLDRFSPSSIPGKILRTPLVSGSSPAINQGANLSNLITVVAQGDTFYLYVNKQYADQASDSTYKSGAIGVYTVSDTNSVEAAFSHLEVWKL